MSQNIYLVLFITFTFFSIKFFEASYRDYNIKEYGIESIATIKDIPNCGRSSNSVEVLLNNEKYILKIGKVDCIKGKYKIGDKVTVLYSSAYNALILPNAKVKLILYMSLLFFLFPLYCLYHLIKPKKNNMT